ncbi:MAG: alpha-amylase [Mediterranea sp.]|jgi:1,4-alpha-glucan branching enzyme|nr:alpha-amylase [Mediterranea sp.]
MKSVKHLLAAFCCVTFLAACGSDPGLPPVVPPTPGPTPDPDPSGLVDGLNYSPAQPNADQALTITFKAPASSPLYGHTGDVYIHIGVIADGTWMYVPADWTENIAKCKMSREEDNVWSVTLSPSIRQWFGSGNTAVTRLGIVIRSADGEKKGIATDSFVDVADNQYSAFQPGAIVEQPKPAEAVDGINIVDNTTVTLVLYDLDKNGAHKDYAHVMGDFNDWTLTNDEKSRMYRDNAAGCWWITLTGLDPAKEYAFQYYVGTEADGPMRLADPYAEKILDPDNDPYIPAADYPNPTAYPAKGVGIVSTFRTQKESYTWQTTDFRIADPTQLIIYEMLLRDFSATGDLAGAYAKLDYLQTLGVNAIELMPVQEFDGNDSWGYNPAFFFAMDKAYGTPRMYKEFVDACHQRGIAVILDVVYNHATGNNPFAKLYWNSSTNKPAANNPWFNVDAPHPYSVFCDFNHESPLVRAFVKRNLAFLANEYKVDGFRFDLAKGFTQKTSNESTSGNYDQSRIDILTDYANAVKAANPDAVVILELFANPDEEKAFAQNGCMLWRNVNNAYCQTAMGWSDGSAFTSLTTWNTDMPEGAWVGYMESHDEERAGYKQTQWANGDLLKADLPTRMAQLGANAAFFLTVSGPKMVWQFGELGYDFSINSNQDGTAVADSYRTSRKPIRWDYYDDASRRALYDTYSRLLKLRAQHPSLFAQSAFKSWKVDVANWNAGRFITLENVTGEKLVAVANFTNAAIAPSVTFPASGTWYEFTNGGQSVQISSPQTITVPANSYRLYTNFE